MQNIRKIAEDKASEILYDKLYAQLENIIVLSSVDKKDKPEPGTRSQHSQMTILTEADKKRNAWASESEIKRPALEKTSSEPAFKIRDL